MCSLLHLLSLDIATIPTPLLHMRLQVPPGFRLVALGPGTPRSLVFLYASLFDSSAADQVANSRPGILVLINDADWELEGEEAYEIQSGDSILFVSTLHGG